MQGQYSTPAQLKNIKLIISMIQIILEFSEFTTETHPPQKKPAYFRNKTPRDDFVQLLGPLGPKLD